MGLRFPLRSSTPRASPAPSPAPTIRGSPVPLPLPRLRTLSTSVRVRPSSLVLDKPVREEPKPAPLASSKEDDSDADEADDKASDDKDADKTSAWVRQQRRQPSPSPQRVPFGRASTPSNLSSSSVTATIAPRSPLRRTSSVRTRAFGDVVIDEDALDDDASPTPSVHNTPHSPLHRRVLPSRTQTLPFPKALSEEPRAPSFLRSYSADAASASAAPVTPPRPRRPSIRTSALHALSSPDSPKVRLDTPTTAPRPRRPSVRPPSAFAVRRPSEATIFEQEPDEPVSHSSSMSTPRARTVELSTSSASHARSRSTTVTSTTGRPRVERARTVEAEVDRIQSRIRERRVSESARMAEARKAALEALARGGTRCASTSPEVSGSAVGLSVEERAEVRRRERERAVREAARDERSVCEAWERYENGWAAMAERLKKKKDEEGVRFEDVAWPVQALAADVEDVSPDAVTVFLLSPLHSPAVARKDRIRAALLRWHPDRFGRIVERVPEGEEREKVQAAVGVVARCLNELSAREIAAVRPSVRKL